MNDQSHEMSEAEDTFEPPLHEFRMIGSGIMQLWLIGMQDPYINGRWPAQRQLATKSKATDVNHQVKKRRVV